MSMILVLSIIIPQNMFDSHRITGDADGVFNCLCVPDRQWLDHPREIKRSAHNEQRTRILRGRHGLLIGRKCAYLYRTRNNFV